MSNFCWQQVGLDRLAEGRRLVADRRPDAEHRPDPQRRRARHRVHRPQRHRRWAVWYEKDPSDIGLRDNEQVFAAKIVADPTADGGFHWQAVGNGTAGQTNVARHVRRERLRHCAVSTDAEDACSLNKVAANDAEDPRVAAGTLTPGGADRPVGRRGRRTSAAHHAIFVSRLVGGDHFELFNGGNPVSARRRGRRHARHHVLRQHAVRLVDGEAAATTKRGFVGHFDALGQFVTDTPGGIRLTDAKASPAAPRR